MTLSGSIGALLRSALLRSIVMLIGIGLLGACAVPREAAQAIDVYRSIGSVQCTGGGESLDGFRRQLTEAGVAVISADCGRDGRMYAAVCGAPDGAIAIMRIAERAQERATALGYTPLAQLPGAVRSACR